MRIVFSMLVTFLLLGWYVNGRFFTQIHAFLHVMD